MEFISDEPPTRTFEREYHRKGGRFTKRSLRQSELQFSQYQQATHVPRQGKERLLNEAAAMVFIASNTNIPVPKLHNCSEEHGAVVLEMEFIEGVAMSSLDATQVETVVQELHGHLWTLHRLESSKIGGPKGHVILPYRATLLTPKDDWRLKESEKKKFVFCHNDLSRQNVIVDPESLKIKAIIDWEYAGFFPLFFERNFFEGDGPSVVPVAQQDDAGKLIEFLLSYDDSSHTS